MAGKVERWDDRRAGYHAGGRQEPTDVLSRGKNINVEQSGKAVCGIKKARRLGVSLKPECLVQREKTGRTRFFCGPLV
ncbi:MAG: hypothetical protein WCH79_17070, partial [Planctomycetia bacterium]